jgi:hypothetical protein
MEKIEYVTQADLDLLYAKLLESELKFVTATENMEKARAKPGTPQPERDSQIQNFEEKRLACQAEMSGLRSKILAASLEPANLLGIDHHFTAEEIANKRKIRYDNFINRGIRAESTAEVLRYKKDGLSLEEQLKLASMEQELEFVEDMEERVYVAEQELLKRRQALPWFMRMKF